MDGDFSQLVRRVEAKEPGAWDALLDLVYRDLKKVAHAQMMRIHRGHTLSTTVLVHEAFEKLSAQSALPVNDQAHFYALSAAAMRQIIIDHYRRRTSQKRTQDHAAMTEYETRRVTPDMDAALTELGRTLALLEQRDPQLLRVFELRFLVGMTCTDIAHLLAVSERTVQRLAARGRAWVASGLSTSSESSDDTG